VRSSFIASLTILSAAFIVSFAPCAHAQVTKDNAAELALAAESQLDSPVFQEILFDTSQRMTVPVRINESAEYAFIVDTGSERTVIANQLAKILALKTGSSLRLATIGGPVTVNSFIVEKLTTTTARLDGLIAPGLDQNNIGAFGLLGLDSLQNKKIDIDMRSGTMSVFAAKSKSAEARSTSDMIVVSARRKGGRLILTNAAVNGKRVDIIIDTGSQSSLGNSKLRNALLRQNRKGGFTAVAMQSVTGKLITGDYTQIRSIEIGGIEIADLPITFSENYAMQSLDLDKRPAIFLGMDALKLFDRVIIDFARKQVSFGLPKRTRHDSAARLASAE
jgi:predicted aspartyl protease